MAESDLSDASARDTPARLRTLPSWLVNQVAIAANRLTDQALGSAGARRHHYAMLAALAEFGPASQAELGRCTGIDRSDVVAAVTALAERGRLQRMPDPADGRRNIVSLTPAGTEYLAELEALVGAAQDELLRGWTAADRERLVRMLTRIVDGG